MMNPFVQYLEHGAEMIITEEDTEFSLVQVFVKAEKSAEWIVKKKK